MEIDITEKKENILLQRWEIKGAVKFSGATPSNAQLIDALAKEMNTPPELVVINHIYNRFSQPQADVFALVYKDQQAKKKIETAPEPKKKEGETPAEKKKGEQ